jgi:hypothetical protein
MDNEADCFQRRRRRRRVAGEVRGAGELQVRGASLIWSKIEQNKRIRRSARAREGVWEKKEGAGIPEHAGIERSRRRHLQVSVKKFVGLEKISREEKKGDRRGV